MPCGKCVVCNIKFEIDIPNANIGNPNEEKVNEKLSLIYRKILRIFCSCFNLPQNENENDNGNSDYAENTNENGILFSFPFCSECRNLVAELCIFHEKFEAIQKLVQKSVAKITVKILNTENEQENSSTSNSISQNENENEEEKENGNASKYRQKIIQNFSPRVLLTKYQKQNSEPKQMQRNETNGILLATNSNEENSLIDERCHDNDSENDDQNETDKITKTVNKSNQNDNENSASSPAPEKRSQNLMEKIRSMAKTGQKAPKAKTRIQLESFVNGFTTIGNKFVHSSGKWWAVKTNSGWKCATCQKILITKAGARGHIEMEHVTGNFKCENCPRSFFLESLLRCHGGACRIHKLKPAVETGCHDNESQNYYQNEADKITKPGVESNQNSASSPAPEKASQNLMEIIQSMAKIGQKVILNSPSSTIKTPFQPESSSTGFTTIDNKYIHNSGKWWAEETDFGWKCNSCSKIFSSKGGARAHLETKHVTGKFKCKICQRSFVRQSLLEKHCCGSGVKKIQQQNTSTVEVGPASQCDICGLFFPTKSLCDSHVETHLIVKLPHIVYQRKRDKDKAPPLPDLKRI